MGHMSFQYLLVWCGFIFGYKILYSQIFLYLLSILSILYKRYQLCFSLWQWRTLQNCLQDRIPPGSPQHAYGNVLICKKPTISVAVPCHLLPLLIPHFSASPQPLSLLLSVSLFADFYQLCWITFTTIFVIGLLTKEMKLLFLATQRFCNYNNKVHIQFWTSLKAAYYCGMCVQHKRGETWEEN